MPAFMHCGDEENNLAEHPQDDDVVQISTTDATSYFHAASHAAKQDALAIWWIGRHRDRTGCSRQRHRGAPRELGPHDDLEHMAHMS
ncbi:hypothetical protein BDA96_09G107500 [Sorghum bicolor]|uniref:Uncharacterized protein n=2 Tax=Sorghum bicolor TaxID=4558 RepID=A0A921U3S0_SORBI|nr:hypothetical protein BDA96_09G107500 [Sorghum bicolor]KAG0517647.1 hypothetical protein BDA96_09G107500 [Sorghum bicolor]KXG21754.1 hypothetical protein SORBI_3009G103400 [Sorghum bicolor]OQU77792.1 hypothetical protein SORBI_3009G103400 [Sorghum bicolor]